MKVIQIGVRNPASPSPTWPPWARLIAKLRNDADLGVGDTIARVIGPIGGDAFKRWAKAAGRNCGCEARQEQLNARFTYPLLPVDKTYRHPDNGVT